MQLYFIRHAQSENNAIWARTGSSEGRRADPGLTTIGWRQARLLARFLAQNWITDPTDEWDAHNRRGFHFTHLYCSLMRRAVATGNEIAQAVDVPLRGWPDIHERGGIYLDDAASGEPVGLPGENRAFFAAYYPRLRVPATLRAEGWWNNRSYETAEEALERARLVIEELLARHGDTDDCVAMVSHGGFYHSVLSVLLDSPLRANGLSRDCHVWLALQNTAISRFDFFEGRLLVTYMNRIDFMPASLITY